jgi:hypothetical protein
MSVRVRGWGCGSLTSTSYEILNNKVNQKRSKAMDMRFYWVHDRILQGQYRVYCELGGKNLADYFTKHYSTAHHRSKRSQYVHTKHPPMKQYNAAVLKHTVQT